MPAASPTNSPKAGLENSLRHRVIIQKKGMLDMIVTGNVHLQKFNSVIYMPNVDGSRIFTGGRRFLDRQGGS